MSDVVMPRLSDSMEEGTILKWLKADGDEVARGEELAEIETDKATMTYEADADGRAAASWPARATRCRSARSSPGSATAARPPAHGERRPTSARRGRGRGGRAAADARGRERRAARASRRRRPGAATAAPADAPADGGDGRVKASPRRAADRPRARHRPRRAARAPAPAGGS